jgi:hypothetical protein
MSRWFRFYADAMRNPKVLRLSDKDFRLWVRLLAVASENEGHIAPAADLKMVLAMRLDHLEGGLDRLISGGLIDLLDDGYEPHGWAKFQYKSDVSTDRVHKHRAKRNVSETPPETEADTEQQIAEATVVARKRAPAKKSKHSLPENWKPSPFALGTKCRTIIDGWTDDELETQIEHFIASHTAKGNKFEDWQAAWQTWAINSEKFGAPRNGLPARQADIRPSAGSRGERRNPLLDLVRATEEPDYPAEDREPDWQGRPALRAIGQIGP